MDFFFQLLINGTAIGFLYALAALGFVMIFKSSSVLNFAHGELVAIGAFIFLVLVSWAQLPIPIAFLITLIGIFAFGFVIERLFLRPLIGEPLIEIIMLTVGLSSVLKGLMLLIWAGEFYRYPDFLPKTLSITLGATIIPEPYVTAIFISLLIFVLLGFFFKYSSQGIYMRSVADHQAAALSLGVNVRMVFALSWAIAALVAGMSGIVIGLINGLNVYDLSGIGFKVFPVVILGGLNSIAGAIVGGVIIGLIESFVSGYINPSLADVFSYIILVFILMIRPYGLFGLVEIERV